MYIKHRFFNSIRDIDYLNQITNTSILTALEETGGKHSDLVGYGVNNLNKTKRSWILISWKVKIYNRPKFNDNLTVFTWSRGADKLYAYRDFKIYDEKENLVALASSKWILINTETNKIERITDEIIDVYETENEKVFEENFTKKFLESEDYINKISFKITKNMIDFNNHLNNRYYLDLAKEVLPNDLEAFNDFEIIYKKEIKYGENVKVMYSRIEEVIYVYIKDESEKIIHAIIKIN